MSKSFSKDKKAIILAAGKGRRLGDLTRDKPKALVQLHGKPLINHIIERLVSEGINQVYINLHSFADMLANHLKKAEREYPIDIYLSYEKSLLDTGGGIKKIAKEYGLSEPILVHNVDIISDIPLQSLFAGHASEWAAATLAIQRRPTDKYLCFDEKKTLCGRAKPDRSVQKLYRKPDGELSAFAFCGIYVISPDVFSNANEDVFSSINYLLEVSSRIASKGIEYSTCSWQDVGTIEALQKAQMNESNI